MKKIKFLGLVLLMTAQATFAQEVIKLYDGPAPGSENWDWEEKEIFLERFQSTATYDVSKPTLTVYEPENPNGTAVVVCPGGAFRLLATDKEGSDVAKWLNTKGITAFVLKYRLVKSATDNPTDAMALLFQDRDKFDVENAPVVELAINDGTKAIEYVREHAKEYKIDTDKIGIMGFSAGGTVTAGASFNYTSEANKPNFSAPIYPAAHVLTNTEVPADAPPTFIAVASNDGLVPAIESIQLYTLLFNAKKDVELHAYSKGDHGFGIAKSGVTADDWTTSFEHWLKTQGFLPKE